MDFIMSEYDNNEKNFQNKCIGNLANFLCFGVISSSILGYVYYPEIFDSIFKNNSNNIIEPECEWYKFDEWSECENNLTYRHKYGKNCVNNSQIEYNNCTKCEYSVWGIWSECIPKCGNGLKTRNRSVNQGSCHNLNTVDTEKCFTLCPDCNISSWGNWTDCMFNNNRCGNGTEFRYRKILDNGYCNYTIHELYTQLNESRPCYVNCSNFNLRNSKQKTTTVLSNDISPEIESGSSIEYLNYIIPLVTLFALSVFSIYYLKYRKNDHEDEITRKDISFNSNNLVSNPLYEMGNLQRKLELATSLDKKGKYADAYELYVNSSEFLVNIMNGEKNKTKKDMYENYAKIYIERAEIIAKRYPEAIKKVKNKKTNKPPGIENVSMVVSTKKQLGGKDNGQIRSGSLLQNKSSVMYDKNSAMYERNRTKVKHEFIGHTAITRIFKTSGNKGSNTKNVNNNKNVNNSKNVNSRNNVNSRKNINNSNEKDNKKNTIKNTVKKEKKKPENVVDKYSDSSASSSDGDGD
tara:strand:- start:426 stop:1985 length:1560 start_codon:yes stop_codon:yes gene_type:complete